MKTKITFIDEVNILIEGLSDDQVEEVIERTKIFDPKMRHSPGFKAGITDGKVSFFSESGLGFQYQIEEIAKILESCGLDMNEVEIEDQRLPFDAFPDKIDESFLFEEIGFPLRKHQVDAINSSIDKQKGTIIAATAAGKTNITLGISKAYDPYMKSIVLVPSQYLVNQTAEVYERSDLSFVKLGNIKPKDRAKAVRDHRHIIMTYALLHTTKELFEGDQYVIILDEIHDVMGDKTAETLRVELRNCPIRIGLTGSFPKEKLKSTTIKCHMNGGTIIDVTPKEMVDKGYILKPLIEMYRTSHGEVEDIASNKEFWDWPAEDRYLLTNQDRLTEVARFIQSLDKKNTLILCHAQAGEFLGQFFGNRMIRDETKNEDREAWLGEFDTTDEPYYLCASYGTAATGISVNKIHRVVLLDVGKTEKFILQGCGRGMRLDGDSKTVDIVDISANLPFSNRHLSERKRIYKRVSYDYNENKSMINIRS